MSNKETNTDADVPCPNCGNKTFEEVGYTWVGSKNVVFRRYANGSVYSDFDNVESETYWDDMQHLFYECLSCDTAYDLEKTDDGKYQLVEIDASKVSIKRNDIKNQIKELHETKKLLGFQVNRLEKRRKELKNESDKLEKFIAISNKLPEKSILKGLRNIRKNG